ncbi:phosphotransferase enzyme family protein [Streptomyces sp. NBC_00078]|uniref:phosphotransferase enzyme family protein n=1 Tax=unclassified Streptomyces TaxID=2593676 RepID=UPI0022535CC5|nr:phosphotransferase [Streptomyces sp. NBC_00078]MCX5426045.1 phosphotransferase [Streptomyces sp. NBC_00078]
MIADLDAAKRVAARALPHYDADKGAVLTFVKYRENYVFRVDQPGRAYALRLHRSGYRTDAEIVEELELLAELGKAGVAVPQVCLTAAGATFCRVADDDGHVHQVDMLEWVSGAVPLGDVGEAFSGEVPIDPATFHALGALVADLHTKVASLKRGKPSVRAAWDAGGLVGDAPVWGDPRRAFHDGARGHDAVDQAMSLLEAELTTYGKAPDRYGPIHADFTPENVLVHNGHMTVIDFDDSGDGYYLFDLATAAFFYRPHPRFDDIVSALLAGYQSVRPLTQEDLGLWRPLLLARGLTYLAWAADRLGDETSDFVLQHVRPLVVDLAAEFVALTVPPRSCSALSPPEAPPCASTRI